MSPGWYRRWRHAGESDALSIYATTSWWSAPVFAIALAASLYFAHLRLTPFLGLALGITFIAAADLRNLRRALIFAPGVIRYRPTFGPLREVPNNEIFVVKRAAVTEGRGNSSVLAANLTLRYGEILIIPLNMEKGEEALQRLIEIANPVPMANPARRQKDD